MNKLFILILPVVLFWQNLCGELSELPILDLQSASVVLEHVNFSRIEKNVEKYKQLQFKEKWIKRFKYAAVGAGCAGVAVLALNHLFLQQTKSQKKVAPTSESKPFKLESLFTGSNNVNNVDAAVQALGAIGRAFEAKEKRKTFKVGLKKNIQDAVYFVVSTFVVVTLLAMINKGNDALNNYFGGLDPQDPAVYKQKNERINELIKRLGIFLARQEQALENDLIDNKFFDLAFSDILIDHTTLVRWFEDIISFIKCAVILVIGADSLELVCLEKDIKVLSTMLDAFTDKVTLFVNSTEKDHLLISQASGAYMIFCKQFAKFIYDCGFYLYDQDFLQG